MKKNIIISLALIGSLALLASSCVKEITSNDEKYRPAGTPITITASTSYENGPETRAEYSGELYGTSSRYERIDWVKNDPIRVVYNGTPADYKVADGTIQASNEISTADLTGSLEWRSSGSHEFYALYPSGNGAAGSLSNTGYVTGTIPPVQNVTSKTISKTETIGSTSYTYDKYQPDTEHYGYLASYEKIDASSTSSSVELHFKPAFTTFEFKFIRKAGDPNPTIMSAELETETVTVDGANVHTPLTGNFGFQILGKTTDGRGARWNKDLTGSDCTTLSGTLGYKITVGFGDSGVTIPDDGVLDFSILALPIDLNGVKITLKYAGGTQKVLRLKDKVSDQLVWHPFEGARKYVITNMMPSEWVYILEEIRDTVFFGHNAVSDIPFKVISYKYPVGDPSNKVAVPWHIEYSKDDASYGRSQTYSHPDFMLSNLPGSASGLGSTTGEDRASNIIRPNPNYTEQTLPAEDVSRAILRDRDPKGTSTNPYDLSMYDIHGTAHAQTTANSYVVSAPGWYKFPIVYGNAITNGADNKGAYDPYGSGAPLSGHWNWVWNDAAGPDKTNHDVYMTEHFFNALNEPISSPYVLVDVPASSPNAVIIWQDTEADDVIIDYDAVQLVGSGDNAYIQFYIDKDDIHQGNVVLAVRDGSSEDVLWSWQIWVSEKDLTPITSRKLMPYNLGWIDQEGVKERKYTDRVSHYRVIQDEAGGKTEYFKITQIGDENAIPNNTGYNTFYQWGRKDPMASANAKLTSRDYASQLVNTPVTSLYQFPNTIPLAAAGDYHSPSYAYGIKKPWVPTHDPDNNGWVNGQFYPPHEQFWHTDFLRGGSPNPFAKDENPLDGVPDDYLTGAGDAVPHNGAHYRQLSGCPFNLWNAYAYGSDDFSGTDKKFKTVYDPCPPGFCVPTLGTFASIESATKEREEDKGINFIFTNGDAFFLPFSGTRGTRQTASGLQYIVNDRPARGVYWVDAPSAVGRSKFYRNGKWYRRDEFGNLVENNCNAQHGLGFFWYMFAKSLHVYNNLGSFQDEEDHLDYVKYSPEDSHWDEGGISPAHSVGAYQQTQRTGFDDIRSNAFSIRPIVDPKY